MRKKREKDKISNGYGYLQYSAIGLEMGFSVAVGALIGHWLDGKLGTYPWMTALWSFCGMVAGFRSLFKLAKKYMKSNKDENENIE